MVNIAQVHKKAGSDSRLRSKTKSTYRVDFVVL